MTPRTLGTEIHAQPWSSEAVDLESINGAASQAILETVHAVRGRAQVGQVPVSRAHLVLGPPGSGKTHLFGRLRRKLGPRAILVHLRPLVGADLGPRYLLSQIYGQLGQMTLGITQVEALVGSLLAVSMGGNIDRPRLAIEDCRSQDPNARHLRLERLLEAMLEQHPGLDEPVLRALLQLPFLATLFRTATLSWLGGHELDPAQSSRIGVLGALPNERVLGALRTLAVVASPAAPLLLVFDQLENLLDSSDAQGRVRAYAGLVAELVDTVPGLVLVQMAVDMDWARGIEPCLGQAQKSRVLGARHLLALPRPPECRELLERWVERLPERAGPFPWPFTERLVEDWIHRPGLTPRMLLLAADHALAELDSVSEVGSSIPAPNVPAPMDCAAMALAADTRDAGVPGASPCPRAIASRVDELLRRAWDEHLEGARQQIDEAAEAQRGPQVEHLRDGLTLLFGTVLGCAFRAESEGELMVRSETGWKRLYWLHEVDPRSVASRLRRYSELSEPRVLLREQWREFPSTWRAIRSLADQIRNQPKMEWIGVQRQQVERLLALRTLLMSVRSRDLAGLEGEPLGVPRVVEWLRDGIGPTAWDWALRIVGGLEVPVSSFPPPPSVPAGVPRLTPAPRRAVPAEPPEGPPESQAPRTGVGLEVLEELRVASLERILREAATRDSRAVRSRVIEEFEAAGPRVRWFGRSIVALAAQSPREAGRRER